MKLKKSVMATSQPIRKSNQGFTLVEALVAGALIALVMGTVSRLSVSALASSANQSERARIEAAINDNIQLIQMEDSYLKFDQISDETLQGEACLDPALHLATHLQKKVAEPIASNTTQSIERTFIPLEDDNADILVVRYKFYAPESKGKDHSLQRYEYRTIELNPNFSAQCFTTTSS